jgi:hypothetical protein
MDEWLGEWRNDRMDEWKNYFFLIFGNVQSTVEWYRQGKTEGLGEKSAQCALSTTNPTGLTRMRTRAAAVKGRRLIAWAIGM